jgi:hypothetical protein
MNITTNNYINTHNNIHEFINKLSISLDDNNKAIKLLSCLDNYKEEKRSYHNINHLNEMISFLNKFYINKIKTKQDYQILLLAILFHDIVYNYDDKQQSNEELSALYAKEVLKELNFNEQIINRVIEIILFTDYQNKSNYNSYFSKKQNKTIFNYDYLKTIIVELDFNSFVKDYDNFYQTTQLVKQEFLNFNNIDDTIDNSKQKRFMKRLLSEKIFYINEDSLNLEKIKNQNISLFLSLN